MTTDMNRFIELSAVLTGFSSDILAPSLDPIDIKSEYISAFKNNIANESHDEGLVDKIFSTFSDLKSKNFSDQEIGTEMLNDENGENFVLACRKLIFLWYAGAWPTIIPASGNSGASTVSNLLSAKSYTSGLAWQVMQSHPMGDSNYHYGYWANSPAPLSDYTGN